MKRCFVALGIAEPARAAIVALCDELARLPLAPGERLVTTQADNLHLTLKFLGATADERVPELEAALAGVAAEHAAPAAELHGLSAFPHVIKPRAVFAGVRLGREQVLALAEAVERSSVALGFAKEERPRVPHVTVARADRARPNGVLTAFIARHGSHPFGPVDGSGIVLYESRPGRGGSHYEPLARLPFGR